MCINSNTNLFLHSNLFIIQCLFCKLLLTYRFPISKLSLYFPFVNGFFEFFEFFCYFLSFLYFFILLIFLSHLNIKKLLFIKSNFVLFLFYFFYILFVLLDFFLSLLFLFHPFFSIYYSCYHHRRYCVSYYI